MKYFDLHCDTFYKCAKKEKSFFDSSLAVGRDGIMGFDYRAQIYAIWIPDGALAPFSLYYEILNTLRFQLQRMQGQVEICTSSYELSQAIKNNKVAAIVSVEGGSLIGRDLSRIEKMYNDSVRIITLTWNEKNNIAGGVNSSAGLSKFGKLVIDEMNRLSMACDLSHLNKRSFYNVAERADTILATHSNCDVVHKSKRNLSNKQLKCIAQKGGLVGLCFYPDFLGDNVFESLLNNVKNMLCLGMEDNIAIGSDFDGAAMSEELNSPKKVRALYEYFISNGIDKDICEKIFWHNAYNFCYKLLTKNVI